MELHGGKKQQRKTSQDQFSLQDGEELPVFGSMLVLAAI